MGQTPHHQPYHRGIHKRFCAGAQPLVVLAHPPVLGEPGEGPLHHPSTRSMRGAGGGARWARCAQDGEGRGAHRGEGADLVFLPSYSPDLNPIEEAFSKIKHLVRKVGARTREALVEAMDRALAAVTTEDVAGWFAHAGYWRQDQPL
jgi:transposase